MTYCRLFLRLFFASFLCICILLTGCTPQAPDVKLLRASGYGIVSLQVHMIYEDGKKSTFCPFSIAQKRSQNDLEYYVVKQVYSPLLHGMKLKQGKYYIVDATCRTSSNKILRFVHGRSGIQLFKDDGIKYRKALAKFDVNAGEVVDAGVLNIKRISDQRAYVSIRDFPVAFKQKRNSYNPETGYIIQTRLMGQVQSY